MKTIRENKIQYYVFTFIVFHILRHLLYPNNLRLVEVMVDSINFKNKKDNIRLYNNLDVYLKTHQNHVISWCQEVNHRMHLIPNPIITK